MALGEVWRWVLEICSMTMQPFATGWGLLGACCSTKDRGFVGAVVLAAERMTLQGLLWLCLLMSIQVACHLTGTSLLV